MWCSINQPMPYSHTVESISASKEAVTEFDRVRSFSLIWHFRNLPMISTSGAWSSAALRFVLGIFEKRVLISAPSVAWLKGVRGFSDILFLIPFDSSYRLHIFVTVIGRNWQNWDLSVIKCNFYLFSTHTATWFSFNYHRRFNCKGKRFHKSQKKESAVTDVPKT